MNASERLELLRGLSTELAEFPLPVVVHARRNVICATGAVCCALLPYSLLEWQVQELFVVPLSSARDLYTASFIDGILAFLAAAIDAIDPWPFAELRGLGWLFLPGLFLGYSILLDTRTDGKLASTKARQEEHLEHEAETAEGSLCKLNQTAEQTQQFARTLKNLEPKKRLVRQVFTIHRHDLGGACWWPWIIATLVVLCAWVIIGCDLLSVYSNPTKFEAKLANVEGPFLGGVVVFFALVQRWIRASGMRESWEYIRFLRRSVGSVGNAAI